jgi:hypothetical protein
MAAFLAKEVHVEALQAASPASPPARHSALLARFEEKEKEAKAQAEEREKEKEAKRKELKRKREESVAALAPLPPANGERPTLNVEESPVLRFVQVLDVGGKWEVVCGCCTTGTGGPFVIGAWRKGKDGELKVKASNVASHFSAKHGAPLSEEFWMATEGVDLGRSVAVHALALAAAAGKWSLANFISEAHAAKSTSSNKFPSKWKTWAKLVGAHAVKIKQRDARQSTLTGIVLRQSPLTTMANSVQQREKLRLAVYELLFILQKDLSFEVADSAALRALLRTCGLPPGTRFPGTGLVRDLLPVFHSVALELMEEDISKNCSYVSLIHDIWSAQNGRSFLAVIFSFLDKDLVPHELLVELISLSSIRHTGENVAMALCSAVDEHAPDDVCVVGVVSDAAASALKAGRQVIEEHDRLLALVKDNGMGKAAFDCFGAKAVLAVSDADTRMMAEAAKEEAALEGEEGASGWESPDAEFLDDMEVDGPDDIEAADDAAANGIDERTVFACVCHALHLAVMELIKNDPWLHRLVASISRLVSSVTRSTKRTQQLFHAQKILGMKPGMLKRASVTRWNFLPRSILSVIRNIEPLRVLEAKGSFIPLDTPVELPSDGEITVLVDIVKMFERVSVLSCLLQTQNCSTMPLLPVLIDELLTDLHPTGDELAVGGRLLTVKQELLAILERRIGRYAHDPLQPSVIGAFLHPAVNPRMESIFVRKFITDGRTLAEAKDEAAELVTCASGALAKWIEFVVDNETEADDSEDSNPPAERTASSAFCQGLDVDPTTIGSK